MAETITSSSTRPNFDSAIIMGVFATAAVVLRFVAKSWTRVGVTADDLLIAVALATYWSCVGVQCWGIFVGGGGFDMKNFIDLDLEGIAIYSEVRKSEYTVTYNLRTNQIQSGVIFSELLTLGITLVKMSILCLYYHIFPTPMYKRITIALGIYATLWCVSAEIVVPLACIPLAAAWDPAVPGQCIDFNTYFLSLTIVDLVNDVAIFCLPLWVVHTLQLRLRYKVGLSLIFTLGGV